MREGIFRCQKRCCQIVITVRNEHFQGRVDSHRLAECIGDVDILVLMATVVPRMYTPAQDFIGEIRFKSEFAADIVVEVRSIRALCDCTTRIVFVVFACGIAVDPFVSAIKPPDCPCFIAEQFLTEPSDVNPQIGSLNICLLYTSDAADE